ncbi:MAG: RluA family pseudouridine synthase [Rhodoferax sp.]|nr:RluA family pseudouridine synthase [Rhodoferax sp.]
MGTTLVTNSRPIISAMSSTTDLDDPADTAAEHEVRRWQVEAPHHRERLDKVLSATISGFSRSYLSQLVEQGAVLRNGQALRKPSARLQAGDTLEVTLRPTLQSQAFVPVAMDLAVVHEDADLLVIDKPAGLVVHPAPGNWSGTLLNGLLARDARMAELPRAGIVHRLDKDTSGLMLVARSRPAMDALVRMIAQREVRRQYLAIAHRPWTGPSPRDVDAAIGRDPANRLRMAALSAGSTGAKDARTTIELLDNADTACLVRCTLHTGRTHQIRVHMASIGHPLLGDTVYGAQADPRMARQALHAYRLALAHPLSGQPLAFASALPTDMQAALALWGLRYNPAR